GYWQLGNRIASLKLRTSNGRFTICTAYAPHNEKPTEEKVCFYDVLHNHATRIRGCGSRVFFGDWNARLGRRRAGEEDVTGECSFGREAIEQVELPNRDLRVDFCMTFDLVVANALLDPPDSFKATFRETGVAPSSPVTWETFKRFGFDDNAGPPNKPWISQTTLSLLAEKREARHAGNWAEKAIRKRAKLSAKRDRAAWLESLTADGTWNCIKEIKQIT
ncbi:unnamed protein product, partial [Prorocentrum cordatum]